MTYSMDFRRAVAKAYDRCRSSAVVAEQFDCSESWVSRLIQRRRETGSLAPRPMKLPNNNKLNEEDLDQLLSLIRQTPDMTLAELAAALDHKASVTARDVDGETAADFARAEGHAKVAELLNEAAAGP